MAKYKYVILGGGMVAGYAAQEFTQHNTFRRDELLIVSADDQAPYERPPLSKGYLAGKKKLADTLINEPDFYEDHGIRVLLKSRVNRIDFESRLLRLADGGTVEWEQLLIATGAEPRTLDIPGADLPNVFYLRSLDDSTRIREAAQAGRRALVLGSSFIGMETAAVFAQRGLEVTMVFPGPRVWEQFFTTEMSAFFQKYYHDRGVKLLAGRKVVRLRDARPALIAELDSRETLETDLLLAGIGVQPSVELFRNTPLKIDNGIVVNEFLETGIQGVYAAGDVANWRDVIFGKQRRVEHWDNAVTQGAHAARVMLGLREPYIHVPYFFSDEFDLSYEFWGETAGAAEVIHRGDVAGGQFSTWWLRDDGSLCGAFVLNRPDEERDLAQRWIAGKSPVPLDRLRNEDLPLAA